ncbi:unnamed protein product [Ostreobium quekettii]|uniref:Uncharacterized protein n=1 Tax=Ostreobium quekettii TaxID=121088 RepID=A0A8S1ITL3_9CHLO|nr:unnamed protein product [Ostreobium quekettii]|eukprot:evm.model.scf_810.4 EVM.evm.TU.scf_810.4   scf_810:37353-38458(-)
MDGFGCSTQLQGPIGKAMDPSHASHMHHGQTAFGAKFLPQSDLAISNYKQTRKTNADGSFEVSHSSMTADTQVGNTTFDFQLPMLATSETMIQGILSFKLGLHHILVWPGVNRVIFATDLEAKEDKGKFGLMAIKAIKAIQTLQTFIRELSLMLFPGYVRMALRHVCGAGAVPSRVIQLQQPWCILRTPGLPGQTLWGRVSTTLYPCQTMALRHFKSGCTRWLVEDPPGSAGGGG